MAASILLVDDEEDTVSLLALTLRNRGFIAETVASGHQCLERVRHGDVDIVVTDHQMPGMSGVELCHELAIRHPERVDEDIRRNDEALASMIPPA